MTRAVWLLVFPTIPLAAQTVVYRCEDAQGMVSLQNHPCSKGQQARRQVMATPAPPPKPVAPPAPAVREVAPTSHLPSVLVRPDPDAATAANPLPPPELYRCHTYRHTSYLSDTGTPSSRCVPLDGTEASAPPDPLNPQPHLCDMQQDTCERIPDQELCTAWAARQREAEALVKLGSPEIAEQANALRERATKVMTQTTCAPPAEPQKP